MNESRGRPQKLIRREQARDLCFTIVGNKGSQLRWMLCIKRVDGNEALKVQP